MATMKAVVVEKYGGPEVLELRDSWPVPVPKDDEVLIGVKASGVNPVDTYLRSNTNNYGPALPYVPGKDGAGVVEGVGSAVTRLKVGDRVWFLASSGSAAEKATAPEKYVYKLPDNVAFKEGAAVGVPYGTAWRALFQRAGAAPGETVLIHGASGGVGLAATQIARAAGLIVIGTASTEEGREAVLKNGAHHVVNHHKEEHFQEVLALTNGKGVDVIIEMLANVNLERDGGAIAKYGRIVVVGNRGSIEINPRAWMGKDVSVHGMSLFNAPDDKMKELGAGILGGLESGVLKPVVAWEGHLKTLGEAHEKVIAGAHSGNYVIVIE